MWVFRSLDCTLTSCIWTWKWLFSVYKTFSVKSIMNQKYNFSKRMTSLNLFDLCSIDRYNCVFCKTGSHLNTNKEKAKASKKVSTFIGKTRLGSLDFNSLKCLGTMKQLPLGENDLASCESYSGVAKYLQMFFRFGLWV